MNPSNGRIESDPMESRGGPPIAAADGTDASRLAAAKEAAKKKLLRMVVQQATEELGDADAIVEQAFSEGLVTESLIEGLRQSVRARMTARLVRHVAENDGQELAAEAAAAMAEAPEVRAAVESVERRLAGTIAAKALEGMEDEAAVAERIAGEIARANEAAVGALADDVRGMVMQTITDRAWASAVDPDELVRLAEGRVAADDPTIVEAATRLAEAAADAASSSALEAVKERIAQSIATTVHSDAFIDETVSQVEIEPEVVERATAQVRRAAVADLMERVSGSLDTDALVGELATGAASAIESDVLARVASAVRENGIEDRVAQAVREDAIQAVRERVLESLESSGVAAGMVPIAVQQVEASVLDQVAGEVRKSGVEARVAEAVHAETIQAVRERVLESLESSSVAAGMVPDTVAVIESTVLALVTDAIRESSIVERVTEQVKASVCDRVTDAVFDAESLMQRMEERIAEEPARLQEAAEQARAEFAVQLTEDLIAAVTADEAIASLTDQAVAEVRVRVAQDVSRRVLETTAEDLAEGAVDHFDAENEQVLASVGIARLELLRHIASRAESSLADAAGAARQALASFDFDGKVVASASDALRAEVVDAIAHKVASDLQAEGVHSSDARIAGLLDASRTELIASLYERILGSVTAAESSDELRRSVLTDPAVGDLVDTARAEAWKTLSSRVATRLLSSPADELADSAAEQVEAEASLLDASVDVLRTRMLALVADRTASVLADADAVAAAAAEYVPADAAFFAEGVEALRGRLTAQIAGRVLEELETEGIPTDDPRMEAATQSVRTLVSGFLYAQAMKVASSAKERDRVAREVATELKDLILADTLEAFASRSAADLATEAHGRIEGRDELVDDARAHLADRLVAEIASTARAAVAAEGIDLAHPAVIEAMAAIESDARSALKQRVYEVVRTSDARDQVAAEVATAVHDQVTADALKAILSRNPIELAQAVAAQLSGDEPVIEQAVQSVLASVRADVARLAEDRLIASADGDEIASDIVHGGSGRIHGFVQAIAETLRDMARERAVDEVATHEVIEDLARSGADVLRDRVVVRIAQEIASVDAEALASEAGGLVQQAPAAQEAAELLHARIVERIAADALGRLGSVAAASEKARAVAESENVVIEDAVRTLYDMLSAQVGEEVNRRIRSTDQLAHAAAGFVDPDDPAVETAAEDVARDLGRLVALRAVERVTDDTYRERLVAVADEACADDMAASVDETEKRLLDRLVERIAQRFSDAGETARRAQERLGSDHAPLIAAGEVLKELVLEDLSRKATLVLLDAAQAADRAFSRINLDDPRFAKAQDALRQRIVDAVAERSLRALEDHEAAAGMVRARIADDHENMVGTAALVRDMLIDDIARRSEASLSDARTVARLSRQRVSDDSVNLANAGQALRELLLDDLVRMTTRAFEDASTVAEQAAGRVDAGNDVLVRARAAFKERILMNVLGEAIREISGSFGNGQGEAQQAIFQQTLRSVARESAPAPAPPATDRGPVIHDAPSADVTVPFVTAPEVRGTPPGAESAASAPVADDAPSIAVPEDAWVRLSDFDSDVYEPEAEPVDEPDVVEASLEEPMAVIVTEFIEHEDEVAEDEDAFDFAWAGQDETGGDSSSRGEAALPTFDGFIDEIGGDGQDVPVEDEGDGQDVLPTYVYGFVAADGAGLPDGLEALSMESGYAVRFVTVRSVRAIVSAVPSDDFRPDALRARSQDTTWLRDRIRTHARVLDAFKASGTVVPLRFGTVFENEGDVAAMIQERYGSLSDAIDRLQGKMEWGVRAVRNRDRLRARVLQSERAVEESLGSLSTGVAQFVRDELSRATDLEPDAVVETITQHCLARADEALSRWATDAVEKPVVPGKADVVMNRAYLVEQSAVSDFRAEIARLTAEAESLGIAFELTGPWPAFHFSGIDDSDLAGTVPA